jgi:hypothetical protein
MKGLAFKVQLDHIIFVRRRSPDWRGLACDYEAGMPIDPSRYKRVNVLGFPEDIDACIRIWNDTFPVNFFRCRQVLKEISERTLRQISNGVIISEDRIGELPAIIQRSQSLLFFFDDDDLFAPGMFGLLSAVDFGKCDVAVFPLVHLGEYTYTLFRNDRPARMVLGPHKKFRFRFHTNNYGICSRIALSEHIMQLKDHVLASTYADQHNLSDMYFDVPICATNKTPCSAVIVGGLPSHQQEYRAFIRRYVENLGRLRLPPELEWMTPVVNETIGLFAEI